MFCAECGTEIGEGARFCPACGAPAAAAASGAPAAASKPQGQAGGRRWLRHPLVLGLAVLLAAVAAAAVVVSLVLGNAPEDHAVDLVPADAAFYATVHLDASLGQKRAAAELLERANEAGGGGGGSSTEPVDEAIAAVVEEWAPLDYERDVEPYLGDQIAVYARPGEDSTLLLAIDDPDRARRAMSDALAGEHALAIVDGFAAIGSEEDVRDSIAAASAERSLADVERFAQARSRLSDDVLAFAYVDGEPLLREAQADEYTSSDELLPLQMLAAAGPVAATLTAHDSRLDLDLAAHAAEGGAAPLQGPASLLRTLPAEASLAIAFGDLEGPLAEAAGSYGDVAEAVRDAVSDLAELDLEADVTPWLGQLGAYLVGDDVDAVEGAVVAETRSSLESNRVLDRVEDYYEDEYEYDYDSSVYPSEDGLGFDVYDGEDLVQVRGDEDRVIAGFGDSGIDTERALDAEGGFGDSELYERAAGLLDGYDPFLAIDAPALQRLLEEATEAEYDETYMTDVRDWLAGIETVAGGVRQDGDDLRIRLSAGVGEP